MYRSYSYIDFILSDYWVSYMSGFLCHHYDINNILHIDTTSKMISPLYMYF